MDELCLKKELIKLWKDTFHDSDEYISLVFDRYFNLDNVEYHIENGRIVAAMLGVPYSFRTHEIKNDELKGLYLCGLATKPEYRGRNIMSQLIEKINHKAKEAGYDFTFLIPADKGLIKYYQDRGYVESMFRKSERWLNVHDFGNELKSELKSVAHQLFGKSGVDEDKAQSFVKESMDYFMGWQLKRLDVSSLEEKRKVKSFLMKFEKKSRTLIVNHSSEDWDTVFDENQLSYGLICYAQDANSDVTGVVFVNAPERGVVSIPQLYCTSDCGRYRLLSLLLLALNAINSSCGNLQSLTGIKDGIEKKRDSTSDAEEDDLSVDETSKSNKGDIKKLSAESLTMAVLNPSLAGVSSEEASWVVSNKVVTKWLRIPKRFGELGSDFEIVCMRSPFTVFEVGSEKNASTLWRPFYEGVDPSAPNVGGVCEVVLPFDSVSAAFTYGMLRLLNPLHVLKFLPSVQEGEKYPILVEDCNLQSVIKIVTNNGTYIVNSDICNYNEGNNAYLASEKCVQISLKELSEIIFRRPGSSKMVSEGFGLPFLPITIALMLD